MVIRDFCLKNKYINFCNQSLDLSRLGIYMMSGSNGAGKTSIMKELVFGNQKAEFKSTEQKNKYINNRAELFAYVSQDNSRINISVNDFLCKGNSNISKELLNKYIKYFELEYISPKENVSNLSGGERVKLSIISALLKETPYIFFDEPTNNLDDISVEKFCSLILQMRNEKTFIIISHDERISFKNVNKILVENNSIKTEFCDDTFENLQMSTRGMTPSGIRIAQKIQNKKIAYVATVLISIVFLGLFLFTADQFIKNYSTDYVPDSNAIVVYQVECVYPNLNEIYVQEEDLVIDEKNSYRMMQYTDIEEIAKNEDVQDIFILNIVYLNELQKEIEESKDYSYALNKIISVPDIIQDNFVEQLGLSTLFMLEQGVSPRAEKNEVVMSRTLANELFGFDKNKNFIGETVIINEEPYKIVGIGINDIIWISHKESQNNLFYRYDKNTYMKYSNESLTFQTEMDYMYFTEVNNVVIITKSGIEKNVLNDIMIKYPANNYYSSYFVKQWVKSHNKSFVNDMLLVNIFLSLLVCVFLCFAERKSVKDELMVLKDFEKYYINNKSLKWLFWLLKLLKRCVLLFLIGIMALLITQVKLNVEIIQIYFIDSFVIVFFELLLVIYMSKRM